MDTTRGRRRLTALVGMLVLSMSGAVACERAPEDRSAPAGLQQFYSQQPTWAACEGDAALECAGVDVPLDYARPDRERITIAVSRLKATDPDRRRGVLLGINGGPGGNGGLGLDMPSRFAATPIAEVYDLIGFDPRGTGASSPVFCETTARTARFDTRPPDSEFAAIVADNKAIEAGCQRASGKLRPYVNTPSVARDMDVIRGALGQEKINFVGYSDGTYTGAVYGTLFPDRSDRSVLDSSRNPDLSWREQFMSQAVATRANVDAWAEWAAQHDSRFGLGATPAAVLVAYEEARASLWTQQLDGVYPPMLDVAAGPGTTFRPLWDEFAGVVGELRARSGAVNTADAATALQNILELDAWVEPDVGAMRPGITETVTCEDEWPTDMETYYADTREFRERYPYGYGALRALPFVCAFRSFTPSAANPEIERDGYPVGVVVAPGASTTLSYPGGVAMAERLGDHLVSVPDEGHTEIYALGRNGCVDDYVTAYLVHGTLPPHRVSCAGPARPDPATGHTGQLTGAVQGFIQQAGLRHE